MANDERVQRKKDLKQIIGKNIKKYRKDKQISQRKAARKCGLSPGLWHRYENGETLPGVDVLLKYAKLVKVTIYDLLDLSIPSQDQLYEDVNYFLPEENHSHLHHLREYIESPQRPEDVAKLILKISE